ncbi:hypothetical protein PoB_004698000, partial [Plakobranchus ocellatus]
MIHLIFYFVHLYVCVCVTTESGQAIFWGPLFPCRDCTTLTLTSTSGLNRSPVPKAAHVRRMTLVRETSFTGNACVLGSTFGFVGSDAWVDQGCSGEFRICYIE